MYNGTYIVQSWNKQREKGDISPTYVTKCIYFFILINIHVKTLYNNIVKNIYKYKSCK